MVIFLIYIVVPMFNCDSYITDTLIMLKNQERFKDIAFLFVDDYSTDDTIKIVEYELRDDLNCLVLQNKYNKGIGSSRNTALQFLVNRNDVEYVGFYDVDDKINLQNVFVLAEKMRETKAQIGVGDWNIIDSASRVLRVKDGVVEGSSNIYHREDLEISDIFEFTNAKVWNKLFDYKFIKDNCIRFSSCSYGEDMVFVYHALSFCDTIYYLNKVLYDWYLDNPKSASKRLSVSWRDLYESLTMVRNIIVDSNRINHDEKISLLQSLLTSSKIRIEDAIKRVDNPMKQNEIKRYGYKNFIDGLEYKIEKLKSA